MAVLGLVACSVALVVSETASAQNRGRGGFRGVGVGVGVGGGFGGYRGGYGGGFGGGFGGYGRAYPGMGYGGGFGNGGYGRAYPGVGLGLGGGYFGSNYSQSNTSSGYTTNGYSWSPSHSTGYSSTPAVMMSSTGNIVTGGCGSCDPCNSNAPMSAMAMPSDPNTRSSSYTPNSEQGLRVVEVTPQGPAATAGIQSGATIESVDGKKVWSFDQLQRAVQETNRKGGTLSVILVDAQGQRHTRTVAVRDNMIGVSVVEANGGQPSTNGVTPNNDLNQPGNTIPQNQPIRNTPEAITPGTTNPDRTTPGSSIPNRTPGVITPDRNTPSTTTPNRTTPDTVPSNRPLDSTRPRD